VEVFPAHFEGSCGKGMCGRPSTTIGFERRFNPVLQMTRDDFLRTTGEVPARPLNMTAILATNQGRAEYGWVGDVVAQPVGEVPSVTPSAAPAWIAEHNAVVLDVREPEEFVAGHLPSAVSIPQAELAVQLRDVPHDRDVLVACRGGSRSLAAARFLRAVGYERVMNLAAGTQGWIDAGNPIEVS
jgi:rhodanese-related sulfurtransferase